jgi:hypothetical protein
MLEIRGTRGAAAAIFGLGVVLVLLGGAIVNDKDDSTTAGLVILAIGSLVCVITLRGMLSRAPLVRGTEAGLSFAGRRIIPWSAIKQIYVGRMNLRVNGIPARTQSIAIDFHRKRTLLRLPVSFWIGYPLAIGDVDISAPDRADVTASRLEAMRVTAVGTEDGATIGSSDLPAARVVERDR